MSVVSLLNVDVQNNPASITEPYEFIITFECLEPLQKGLPAPLNAGSLGTELMHRRLGMEADLRWFRYFVRHRLMK